MSEIISGDAGKIMPIPKGTYDNNVIYEKLDFVYYNGVSYIAKKETSGNPPAANNEFWQIFAGMEFWKTNTKADNGFVKRGNGNSNKAWMTDENGNPDWRDNFAKRSIYGDTTINFGRKQGSLIGGKSLAFGEELESSGYISSAFGSDNISSGNQSFAEGYKNVASGNVSHVEGMLCKAIGKNSHAGGLSCIAEEEGSFVHGYGSTAMGKRSVSIGFRTFSVDNYTSSFGASNIVSGFGSSAENVQNISGSNIFFKISSYDADTKTLFFDKDFYNFTLAFSHIAIGEKIFIINKAYINDSYIFTISYIDNTQKSIVVEGDYLTGDFDPYMAVLIKGNAENQSNNPPACHAEGRFNIACGHYSHVEGSDSMAIGSRSHSGGFYSVASNFASCAIGKHNVYMSNGGTSNNETGHVFVIGNGTDIGAESNAFSVMYNGTVKAQGTITASTAADYAEFFEWNEGNLSGEDRVGRFVTLDGDKIRIANEYDDYILGIVSGMPCILGNGDCDTWNGMYLRDDFGRVIMEPSPKLLEKENGEWETVLDNDGNVIYEGERPVLNPEYDPRQRYISRIDRPEWSPVGMLGVLSVYDDGSCQVNGYCKCGNDGIATESDQGYRVISRLQDNIIKVVFK